MDNILTANDEPANANAVQLMVKLDEIKHFCESKQLTNVNVELKQQSNGGGALKTEYYVSFTCKCGRPGRKKYKELKHNPICKLCMKAENPRVADETIKNVVEANGHEFVRTARERSGKTRILVTFICKCSKTSSRKESTIRWDHFCENKSNCETCAEVNRRESMRQAYAERGDEIKDKIKLTMLERYGVEHPSHSEVLMQQRRETNIERYGYEYACQHPATIAKIEASMTEKYGVRHYMQNSEMREKYQHSGFRVKQYTFPSGRVVDCQGYEPFAYEILLEDYTEDDILVESDISNHPEIPQFWYTHNGKSHRYYPDICLWSDQKIIEIKSEWTAAIDPEILELKRQCVLDNCFEYEMWILDRRGDIIRKK